jgi:hypothetical protein
VRKKIYELHEEERQKGKGEVMRQWRNLSTLIFVISKLIFLLIINFFSYKAATSEKFKQI